MFRFWLLSWLRNRKRIRLKTIMKEPWVDSMIWKKHRTWGKLENNSPSTRLSWRMLAACQRTLRTVSLPHTQRRQLPDRTKGKTSGGRPEPAYQTGSDRTLREGQSTKQYYLAVLSYYTFPTSLISIKSRTTHNCGYFFQIQVIM